MRVLINPLAVDAGIATFAFRSKADVRGTHLHEMKSRGVVPLAIVLNSVNPILAQGAALGNVAMLAGFDIDITAAIPNGADVEVNPIEGWLKAHQ